jgi:pyruvate formate lyase activating enzyme
VSRDESALVFDVQRFSIHDGPGIRTVVFFRAAG